MINLGLLSAMDALLHHHTNVLSAVFLCSFFFFFGGGGGGRGGVGKSTTETKGTLPSVEDIVLSLLYQRL